MTIWTPDLADTPGPRYRALADAIARAIESGALPVGVRLPPQRELAYRLGVTVGTVGRAYALIEQRGLAVAEVGRGTFVRPQSGGRAGLPAIDDAVELIDLTLNEPPDRQYQEALPEALAALARPGAAADDLLRYTPRAGLPRHRQAAAEWLARLGLDASPAQVIVTAGAHGAIVAALAALLRPGEVALAETLSYAGLRAIATSLHLRLEGVAMDEQGLRPEALDAACRTTGARVLFTNPTLHNPTATTLPAARREAVVEIARRHDLTLVEDDVYGLLRPERPPALAHLAPERTLYLTGLAKTLAPGLRVGILLAPPSLVDRIVGTTYDLFLSRPALMAEIFAHWVADGTAERLIAAQRAETAARQTLAGELLDLNGVRTDPASFHLWLPLPAAWRTAEFVEAARERGVAVAPGEAFRIGHAPLGAHAVRLSLSAPPVRARLAEALAILRTLLAELPGRRVLI